MKNRKMLILAVSLILVTMLFAFVTFKPQAQDRTQQQTEQQDEATVVQRGQVTDKEREHSKAYKKLYPQYTGRKLTEPRKLGGRTEDFSVFLDIPQTVELLNVPARTATELLRELSCEADAIVFGAVKTKAAHLFEDETLVYTEYEFSVEDVLKNNSASPIEINNTIEVTRPGGVIKLDNRRIKVVDASYEPLQKNKTYLLFLRYVASANSYIVSTPKGDFLLENNSFRTLSKRALPEELRSGDNPQELLNKIRNSVSAGCNQNSSGVN